MSRISIAGTIGCEAIAADVRAALDASDGTVELYIDSPGGDVLESNAMSLAISEYALRHPEKQYTCTLGSLCASAAANILAKLPACFTVRAYSDTLIMYHSCNGFFEGGPQQLKDYAVMMELVNEGVIRALSQKTTLPIEEIKGAFDGGRELWLDAQKAKECGLVGEIIGQPSALARYTETGAVKQILSLVAQYKQHKLEAEMAEENKEPTAVEEVVVTPPAEEKPAEETKKEIEKEVEKELDTPPEVDWQAECEKLRGECDELKKELDALKALVAKYTPSAKPQAQPQPKADWLTLVHALNERKLTDVEYAKEYGRLKAEHKAEFDAFMAAHATR
jgi:ATP-dependent protease ClpP protease subunit